MAKIYYNKYRKMIDDGTVSVEEAIVLINQQVPEPWTKQVEKMILADYL